MLLSLTDIHLTLPASTGDVSILRGVSFTLPAAKSVAIVGPSGSGKTSLLMICAGLLKPQAGQILFEGQDITHFGEDKLAALRRDTMGIVFQNFHLIPTMTAIENVAIPLELARIPDATARAEQALKDVGLSHRLDHYPSQLSGGEQQRVAIARALSMKPKLILADEPTGNLDQTTGKTIMDLLFDRVRAHGSTLALITHDPTLAAACDLQIHIQDGKVMAI
ncbi:MAG TPA: ABC transporter [Rhodospirillaceae bacterium]|nr:ABC transporter [Rhodospirillaceae bacterium]